MSKRERVPKFKYSLTGEQKEAKAIALKNKIIILDGIAGTSKTSLAANIAFSCYIKDSMDRILLTRPTIQAGNNPLGFLPGGIDAKEGKLAPYIEPIIDNMKMLREPKEIDLMVEQQKIVAKPIQLMRGFNLKNSILIVDESQSCTVDEFLLITTRLCEDSKIIFTVDKNQIDLKFKQDSWINHIPILAKLEGIAHIELKGNFRDNLVQEILNIINI